MPRKKELYFSMYQSFIQDDIQDMHKTSEDTCFQNEDAKNDRLAFFLLNHFLDLCDAIDDQDPSAVDGTVFEGTDIPQEVPLPEHAYTTVFFPLFMVWNICINNRLTTKSSIVTFSSYHLETLAR